MDPLAAEATAAAHNKQLQANIRKSCRQVPHLKQVCERLGTQLLLNICSRPAAQERQHCGADCGRQLHPQAPSEACQLQTLCLLLE
jgi:hypothetical protein